MKRLLPLSLLLALALPSGDSVGAQGNTLSFFITSVGKGQGADLGGLSGADAHCQSLAAAAGAGNRVWRAYLSAAPSSGQSQINARDRIGSGPWVNAKGVEVASNVSQLHSDNNKLSKANSLTEKGEVVNGRGDTPNKHDIMTGSGLDGSLVFGATNCNNWTSSGEGSVGLGHHDRQGGGTNPTSWNFAHASTGCGLDKLRATGGDGLFYCFASK